MKALQPVVVAGSAHEIGHRLGELARPVMAAYTAQSGAWQAVMARRGDALPAVLRREAESAFPEFVAEIDGMAAGLGLNAADLFAWNCRGELLNHSGDGCTTVAASTPHAQRIVHNEDGDPFLLDRCLLVDVRPERGPGFVSFYYPGSLPGHTFAVNRAGLVQTINNVRITAPAPGVPRMVLARAVLAATSLDAALAILREPPRASGFHHMLGRAGEARVHSVEASVARTSVLTVEGVYGHANHLVHPGPCADVDAQIVTASSRDRQARLAALLPALDKPGVDALAGVLADRGGPGLPIFRDDPADPDDENTLATASFEIDAQGVDFVVRRDGQRGFAMRVARQP
ncbi:C45 family autoproteolytic acyltransferase/hydolase [Burkholderia plantarii]|uniref:Putative peptidase C45, acyl-coenzyme A:6-aminopenicillanic acid acyl-transferase n=1 Tax=Burkholderia plantarii TaxID=41899 RepID=A0A0B6SCI0_BURPL|nr:C45 family peptidase [Burkholderia plantarii]AJK51000.1 putative peptidase C45, acyl-coenzyme A:6-aminopenicillanic acid acyl-transferase [Burkholderia plantarii]